MWKIMIHHNRCVKMCNSIIPLGQISNMKKNSNRYEKWTIGIETWHVHDITWPTFDATNDSFLISLAFGDIMLGSCLHSHNTTPTYNMVIPTKW